MIVNFSRALLVENFLLCVFIALCNFCRHSVNNGGYMMEKHRNLVWWKKNCCCCVEWHGNLSILHVHEKSNFVIGDIQCQSKVLSVGWWNNKTKQKYQAEKKGINNLQVSTRVESNRCEISVIECISEYEGLYCQRVLLVPGDICGYFNKCQGWWVWWCWERKFLHFSAFLDAKTCTNFKSSAKSIVRKVDFRDLTTKRECSWCTKKWKFFTRNFALNNATSLPLFLCHIFFATMAKSKVTDLSRF